MAEAEAGRAFVGKCIHKHVHGTPGHMHDWCSALAVAAPSARTLLERRVDLALLQRKHDTECYAARTFGVASVRV